MWKKITDKLDDGQVLFLFCVAVFIMVVCGLVRTFLRC
jgi:hypothetical protein